MVAGEWPNRTLIVCVFAGWVVFLEVAVIFADRRILFTGGKTRAIILLLYAFALRNTPEKVRSGSSKSTGALK